jgi:hypothetical protein
MVRTRGRRWRRATSGSLDKAGAPRRRRHQFGRPSCGGSPASILEIKKHTRGFWGNEGDLVQDSVQFEGVLEKGPRDRGRRGGADAGGPKPPHHGVLRRHYSTSTNTGIVPSTARTRKSTRLGGIGAWDFTLFTGRDDALRGSRSRAPLVGTLSSAWKCCVDSGSHATLNPSRSSV